VTLGDFETYITSLSEVSSRIKPIGLSYLSGEPLESSPGKFPRRQADTKGINELEAEGNPIRIHAGVLSS
jgi:hypothetical protein